MHAGRIPLLPLLLFIVCACFHPGAAQEAAKAVGRVEPVSGVSKGNAAIFIGVNEFQDESLRTLNFAVNDAIAQAHLFVLELKLIAPANATLLLTGNPGNAKASAELEALKKSGVRVSPAQRSALLRELVKLNSIAQNPSDLVVVSISSHGFEENGIPYAMPADGLRDFLADSAISLKSVEHQLARSKAGKRLLLVDACREKVSSDGKGGDQPMSTRFREALAAAEGQAVLASCDVGQLSFEENTFGHGVFTHFLLEGIRGNALSNSKGFITLGSVSDYIAQSVNEWVRRNKAGANAAQKPWFKGPNDAREIPLAVSMSAKEEALALENRKEKALNYLSEARKKDRRSISGQMEDAVDDALQNLDGAKLEDLLEQLEALSDPKPVHVRNFSNYWHSVGAKLAVRFDENAERLATVCFDNVIETMQGPQDTIAKPCPSGGKYTGRTKEQPPRCSIPLHNCIWNLKMIELRKLDWQTEQKKATTSAPTLLDLFGAVEAQFLACPERGVYSVGTMHEKPACNAPDTDCPSSSLNSLNV